METLSVLQNEAPNQVGNSPAKRRSRAVPVHEHALQVAVVDWANLQANTLPALKMLYAVPNGGRRAISVARKLKAEGARPGVPDLVLPVPANGFCGLYVEMKTRVGTVTPEQKQWHAWLRGVGQRVEVCRTTEAAIEVLRAHATAFQAAQQ